MARRGVCSNREASVEAVDRISKHYPTERASDLIDAALAFAAANPEAIQPYLEQVPERARRGGRPTATRGRTGTEKYVVDLVEQDFQRALEIELLACEAPSASNINVILEAAMRLGLHLMRQPPDDLAKSMIEQEKKRRKAIREAFAKRASYNSKQ